MSLLFVFCYYSTDKGGSSRPSGGGGQPVTGGPSLLYPQNWKLRGCNPLFLDGPKFTFEKKVFWELYDAPLPGLSGPLPGFLPHGSPEQPVGTNQTNQATSKEVPKFVDLCRRRHPVVNNFPHSHVIFKVNFPLSNDPLALVSAKRKQQHKAFQRITFAGYLKVSNFPGQ